MLIIGTNFPVQNILSKSQKKAKQKLELLLNFLKKINDWQMKWKYTKKSTLVVTLKI